MNASVNIDLYTALLGGEVIIQLGNGQKLKLKVKPETQNGTKVRLRGKGYDIKKNHMDCGMTISFSSQHWKHWGTLPMMNPLLPKPLFS